MAATKLTPTKAGASTQATALEVRVVVVLGGVAGFLTLGQLLGATKAQHVSNLQHDSFLWLNNREMRRPQEASSASYIQSILNLYFRQRRSPDAHPLPLPRHSK